MSTDLACTSATDSLAYTADCATVSRVTAQLGVNRYAYSPTSNLTRLELYIYNRQSKQTGVTDRVDRFVAP
jgi:hypothetical protein